MKYFTLYIIFLGLLSGQIPSKADYFLEDQTRLDALGEKSSKIKQELRKLENSFNDELKITKKRRTFISENFDEDGYLNAILEKENISNNEVAELRENFTIKKYKTETILNQTPIIIPINKVVYNNYPKWPKIVEYIGGYTEIAKRGITKNDSLRFHISASAKNIELTSLDNCYINIQIEGNKNFAFKFHQVEKIKYKYKGSFEIPRFSIYNIYKNEQPSVIFSFKNKKYLPAQVFKKPIIEIMSSLINLDKLYRNYNEGITQIFDDIISDNEFYQLDEIQPLVDEFNKKTILINKAKEILDNESLWLDETKYNDEKYFNFSMDIVTLERELEAMTSFAAKKNRRAWCYIIILLFLAVESEK